MNAFWVFAQRSHGGLHLFVALLSLSIGEVRRSLWSTSFGIDVTNFLLRGPTLILLAHRAQHLRGAGASGAVELGREASRASFGRDVVGTTVGLHVLVLRAHLVMLCFENNIVGDEKGSSELYIGSFQTDYDALSSDTVTLLQVVAGCCEGRVNSGKMISGKRHSCGGRFAAKLIRKHTQRCVQTRTTLSGPSQQLRHALLVEEGSARWYLAEGGFGALRIVTGRF